MARGKTYREKYAAIDREHNYEPREAVRLVKNLQRAKFAETKMPDLNANDVDQAMKIIEGTARSMGVDVR